MKVLSISPFVGSYPVSPHGGGKGKFAYTFNSFLVDHKGSHVIVVPWKESVAGSFTQRSAGGGTIAIEGPYADIVTRQPSVGGCLAMLGKAIRSGHAQSLDLRAERFIKLIGEFRPDIVHLHYTASDFPAVWATIKPSVPLILTAHGAMPYPDWTRVKSGYVAADKVVFVCEQNQLYACEHYLDVSQKARVIRYPAAPVFCAGPTIPAAERQGVVFVGGLNPRKNAGMLVEALAVQRQHRLVICGEGVERQTLEQCARQHGCDVLFLGAMDENAVAEQVRRAKLLVVPSRGEGFAVTYVEALCCGTPIIGWAPNVLEHERVLGIRCGAPFDPEKQTVEDLAGLMDAVLDSELMSDSHRAELSVRARREYSEERAFGEYLALYKDLITR
jgi:glycosyltransferase involved in cell wall biosynthesis